MAADHIVWRALATGWKLIVTVILSLAGLFTFAIIAALLWKALTQKTAIIAKVRTLARLKTTVTSSFQPVASACPIRCHAVRSSQTILRETRAFAADNLAILRRDKENPVRFHGLDIGHRKRLHPAGQVQSARKVLRRAR